MFRESNMERYNTDEEFRAKIIERKKLSAKNKRLYSLNDLVEV